MPATERPVPEVIKARYLSSLAIRNAIRVPAFALDCNLLGRDPNWAIPQPEANNEGTQAKSSNVVSATEEVLPGKDRHDQRGQATEDCIGDIVRERDAGEADRGWKRFHHDTWNDTDHSDGQAYQRVEGKQEPGSRL